MKNDEKILLGKINQVCDLLDEIDDIIDNNPDNQQQVDYEISDYLHIIENQSEEISNQNKIKIFNDIAESRQKRRACYNIFKLGECYRTNNRKLIQKSARIFFKQDIGKCYKDLRQDYQYRVIDDKEYLKELENKNVPKATGSGKYHMTKELLQEMLDKGMDNKAIANAIGCDQSNITRWKKKFGFGTRTYNHREN